MKNFIYTTLLVFATLFCQAFGAQYEPPQLLDTTICARPGETIQLSKFKPRILELLQNRENSIWSECCKTVKVELGDISGYVIENNIPYPFKNLPDEKINTAKTIQVDVKYTRELVCSNIPTERKADMPSASLAMWHLFGKLLSETETGKVVKISDEATITTLHQATFVYRFELALPDTDIVPFKILGERCFDEEDKVDLSVDSAYFPYSLSWIASAGIIPATSFRSQEKFYERRDERYLYPIICTVAACKGETRSDSIFIGKPTPKPIMDDINCIASSQNSFVAKVKEADSRLSYHWIFEEAGKTTQSKQGDSVAFEISPSQSGVLQLYSTGGCKASDTVTQELHRSVVVGNIQLQGDANCVFIGDTLRFVLQNAPHDTLIWQSGNEHDTLPWNSGYMLQGKDSVCVVSVFSKHCPHTVDSATFNIREDFEVSLGSSPMCVSVRDSNVMRLISNGINPEIHWYGNGVEIDSTTYSTKDSISLRLVNPGGQNLYVAVTAKECGKFRKDSISLRPKPEKPRLDTLWNALTPCIPLGIAETIEFRVQPQEGVKFKWSIPDIITNPDSNSILVSVNYELSDRDTSIPVSVYAYTDGCLDNSETLQDTLYAIGAGLGDEWDVIQQIDEEDGEIYGYTVGFSDDGLFVKDYGLIDPFDGEFLFYWYKEGDKLSYNTECSYYFFPEEVDESFDIFCKLTNKKSLCYSVYSAPVGDVDMFKLQSVSPKSKHGAKTGEKNDSESTQEKRLQENEDTPCPGIALHPNPVHSGTQVNVEGICEMESFTVECYSPQGRLMFRTTAKGDTFTLPTDNYAAGVYIVKIQLDGTTVPVVKKMIII